MEIVINQTAQRVWRNPTALQIGFGAANAILENLQPKHEIFVEALYQGLAREQALTYARHIKLRAAEAEALIKALEPVTLKNTARARQSAKSGRTLASEVPNRDYAEVASVPTDSPIYLAALGEINHASHRLSARGESVWLRRQTRAIFIDKLEPLGELIAIGAARSGIGALIIGDETKHRRDGLQAALETMPLRPKVLSLSQLKERQIGNIDLAILTGQQLIQPQAFAAWINRGVPALGAIVASAADKLEQFLGHVIVPGVSPCWVCLEMQRQNVNPFWPDMASQLIGREMRFDSASAALLLGGKALERALRFIDARNGFGEMCEAATTNSLSGNLWPFAEQCSCRLGVK